MCTKVLVSSTRQPPAAIVRLVVHAAIVWLYAHTMWMSSSVRWDSIAFPTISEVGKYMAYMLTFWTMVSKTGAPRRACPANVQLAETLPFQAGHTVSRTKRDRFFRRPHAFFSRVKTKLRRDEFVRRVISFEFFPNPSVRPEDTANRIEKPRNAFGFFHAAPLFTPRRTFSPVRFQSLVRRLFFTRKTRRRTILRAMVVVLRPSIITTIVRIKSKPLG